MSKQTIAIDFDGTICDWAFPHCGAPKAGVKEAIDKLKDKYEIVISSCRTCAYFKDHPDTPTIVQSMIDYLKEHQIYYDRIDMGNEGKVLAIAYIDDRAVPFKNNWREIAESLMSLNERV